jgi:catechol 2,3-dioxygenase-like lactoylglutathione lyase family enzyme
MKTVITFLCIVLFSISLFASPDEFSSTTIGVGVICSDIEKSRDFYINVIGMIKTGEFDVDAEFAKKSGLSNGLPFHVDVLRLGEGDDATQWKLMSFGDKAKTPQKEFIYNNTGMQYITIMVTNLTPFVERLKEAGVKFCGNTPTPLDQDNHFVLVQDPDGTFIELIGPMK